MGGYIRNLILIAVDVVSIYGVWWLSLWGYRAIGWGKRLRSYEFYSDLWPIGLAFVALNAMFRLYQGRLTSPAAPLSPVEELRRLTLSSILVHLGVIAALVYAFQTTYDYSRAVIAIACVLTGIVDQPLRDLIRGLLKRFDVGQIPVEVKGEDESVNRVKVALARDAYTGFRVVAPSADGEGKSRIVVYCGDFGGLEREIDALSKRYTHIEFVPQRAAFPLFGSQAVSFDGVTAIEMINQRRIWWLRAEKWLLDKVLAILAFVCLSPFFVVIPVLIKLTSRGPVFYRHDRLGKDGERIRVWKFRSMYVDADARLEKLLASDPTRRAEWESNFKLKDDPRVTPLGRFLRKTSMDEFPQLFNVFVGDMAFVGPRPIVSAEVPRYGAAYPIFSSVRPGVTGLWQASGRSDADYERRVALDVHYVLNWSPWLDLWILRKTIGAVLFMRGAC